MEVIGSIAGGVPYWLVLSSLWIAVWWEMLLLLSAVFVIKILTGHAHIDENNLEKSARTWTPIWKKLLKTSKTL